MVVYRIEYEEHDLDGQKFIVVRHPDLPGCHGFGATEAEAMERLGHARLAYLDLLKEMGVEPPKSVSALTVGEWAPVTAIIQTEDATQKLQVA